MKTGKRILCFLLAAVMSCGMGLTGNSMKAEAETKALVAKYIRCGVGMRNYKSMAVQMPGKDDNVKNIKVYEGNKTTKNLVVKQTSKTKNTSATYKSSAAFALYAKKKGTYKIKFDIYKSKNSKRSSHTITVRARGNNGGALDTVTVDGKKVYDVNKNNEDYYFYYTTAKSGKVKFKLDEGCKITGITMLTYKKNSSAQTAKSFKNGKKATFGKYAYTYSYSNSNTSGWNKSMWAATGFKIYYTDKNNKGEENFVTFVINRKAEN